VVPHTRLMRQAALTKASMTPRDAFDFDELEEATPAPVMMGSILVPYDDFIDACVASAEGEHIGAETLYVAFKNWRYAQHHVSTMCDPDIEKFKIDMARKLELKDQDRFVNVELVNVKLLTAAFI